MAFTEAEIWDCGLVTDQLNKAVATAARRASDGVLNQFAANRRTRCVESPIEAVFLLWWFVVISDQPDSDRFKWWLTGQVPIEVGGRKYRLDFEIWPESFDHFKHVRDSGVAIPRLAVELDGHDFHEKTKEQVTHRNVRDRDLQMAGWQVFHISGSELVRDPETVVQHVLDGCLEIYGRMEDALHSLAGYPPLKKP
jgi:hypothetical protein